MSALTNEVGQAIMAYDIGVVSAGGIPGTSAFGVIDASTEKLAIIGSVWHPTVKTGTINIRKVHFRAGAVTLNAASELRVSLQNINAAAGAPYQPDGTQDQFYDFKTATTAITANAWNTTGNLSADRAVDLSADSLGDADSRWLAIVFEYQVFTAADSFVNTSVNSSPTFPAGLGGMLVLNTGAWAFGARAAMAVLECDDGTYAFLRGSTPWSAFSSASVSSTGAIRRSGVKFKFPTERNISSLGLYLLVAAGADGRLVLYDSDGTTELRSTSVDSNAVASAAGYGQEVEFEPVTLAADTFYRFAWVGGTATNATVYYGDVNVAGMMNGLNSPGQNAHWTQADSAGAWTDTTTRRPWFAIGQSAIHDGAGGGGGGGMRLAGHGGLAA